jgi:hypothetical protein
MANANDSHIDLWRGFLLTFMQEECSFWQERTIRIERSKRVDLRLEKVSIQEWQDSG